MYFSDNSLCSTIVDSFPLTRVQKNQLETNSSKRVVGSREGTSVVMKTVYSPDFHEPLYPQDKRALEDEDIEMIVKKVQETRETQVQGRFSRILKVCSFDFQFYFPLNEI